MIPVKIMSGNHHGLYDKSFDSTKTQYFLRFRNDERKHAFKIPDENSEKNMFFSDKLIVSKTRS